jgi:hypothetical protein
VTHSARHAPVAILFVVLAAAMTWPLVLHLRTAVPAPGDPFLNTWILDWDWYATFHRPLHLFQANAFHPARDSLAFSENLYGLAILLFPLRAMGMAPLTAYNIAILAGFAFCGFATYLLGMRITGSALAGVAAGIFFAFVPYRFTQLPHVQHVWAGWLPMLVLALLHYAEQPTWRRAALFGGAFLMNGLTNIHWLLFGSFAIAVAALILWPRWLPLVTATAAACVLLAPFLYPYTVVAKLYGMVRSWPEMRFYSATWWMWGVSTVYTRWYGKLIRTWIDPELWLFPGGLVIVLTVIALMVGWRHGRRRFTVIAIVFIAIGFLGSLGAHAFFHRFLYTYVPGFQAIRVPARWAMIAYLGMSMTVAIATAGLDRGRRWIAVVICALFVMELDAAPIRWFLANPEPPPVYRWLAGLPMHRAIVELPIAYFDSEYVYMYRATAHHHRIINGASGFSPPVYQSLVELAKQKPVSDELAFKLRGAGAELAIVHGDGATPELRDWLRRQLARGSMAFVRRFDNGIYGDWVFTFFPSPARKTTPELETFLGGGATYNASTFGSLDFPRPGEIVRHPFFSGWALSPWGIREVNLIFDNGKVRIPTHLIADATVSARFPWYPRTPRPRFVMPVDRRPDGVHFGTDVQVEIIDGRGVRTLLDDRWISWP